MSATGLLEDGVNVVTNVPLYVVGDINMTSEIDRVQTGTKATDWVPVMLAGDTVTTMSNSWSDQGSRGGVSTADGRLRSGGPGSGPARAASTTQYNMLILTGVAGGGVFGPDAGEVQPVGATSGGLLGGMRLMENWSNAVHVFRGSLVLGWMPVYTQ